MTPPPHRDQPHDQPDCAPDVPDRTVSRSLPVRDERGITTAEYAVGTAAGAGFAGLLYTMLTGGLGHRLITVLFDHVLALLGIG